MPRTAIRTGLRSLLANPLRSALSTLGVVMGTGALVAVLMVGDGVEQFARRQIAETTDLQLAAIVPRTTRSVDGITLPSPDTLHLTSADASALQAGLGPRATVVIRRVGAAALGGFADDSLRATEVIALGVGAPTLERTALSDGRWFADADLAAAAPVVIVSRRLASRLTRTSSGQAALGREITLQGVAVRIVGVADAPAASETIAWVPETLFERVVLPGSAVAPPILAVHGRSIEEMPALVQQMEAWMRQRWPDADQRLAVQDRSARIAQARQSMLVFRLLMGSITGISLLVGGIGIMNVLLATVLERTREIGVRRATGARRRDVLSQFLSESVAITGAGSALGTLLGIAAAFSVTAVMRARTGAPVHAALTWPTLLVAAGSAIVVGLAFGLYPALRAARLSPIEAIRHE